ncbi:hypothetical protein [Sphingomonas sp.]|uniref:hypothetical protein n=1 Tax=Sphingomonas sp. TaxID=28214 RepID=UPI002FD8B62D
MTILAWCIALSLIAFAAWLTAGAILRLSHLGRLIATLSVPSLASAAVAWLAYLDIRHADGEWDVVFFLLSVGAGGATMIMVLPVWFLAEERLGGRMRR